MPLLLDQPIPAPGLYIQFWIDDSTPVFAMVAKVHDSPTNYLRPPINLCFLSPDSAKWVSKLNVDPVVDDGTKIYKAQRWAYLEDNFKPDLTV